MARPLALVLAALVALPAAAQGPDLEAPPPRPVPGLDAPGLDATSRPTTGTAPLTIAYQGALADGGGPVADGTYPVQVRLFDVASGGTALYVEDHTVTTAGGAFALSIGAGAPVSGVFEDVPFSAPRWVEVAVDGTTLAPRTLLEAAPHARALAAGAFVVGDVDDRAAVFVRNTDTDTNSSGVYAETASTSGLGVYGRSTAPTGFSDGVLGVTASDQGSGVSGIATSATGATYGVYGQTPSPSGAGIYGRSLASTGSGIGVLAQTESSNGVAVFARANAFSGPTYGLYAATNSPDGYAALLDGGNGLRVRTPGFINVADAAIDNEDVLIEDSDAILGLYSSAGGSYGSGISFGEVTGAGQLTSKWGIFRGTGGAGPLYVSFGTDYRYGINDVQFRIDTDGSVHADGAFVGGGADLAEFFPLAPGASRPAPGQVVGLRGGRVSLATGGAEQVAVVSGDPAFVGNPDAEDGGALVALVGQVEVAVAGRASTGDLLVASGLDDGTARAVAPASYAPTDGPVLGRVLRGLEAGRALALVGVDEAAALRAVVARQADRIEGLEARLARLEALLETAAAE